MKMSKHSVSVWAHVMVVFIYNILCKKKTLFYPLAGDILSLVVEPPQRSSIQVHHCFSIFYIFFMQ